MQHLDMLGWHTTMSFNRTTTLHRSLLQTWVATLDMSMLILRAHKSTTHRQLHLQHWHLSISPLFLLMLDRLKNIKQNRASD
jgi:arsenate reductase-like glutaredoxin family protein